MNPLPYRKSWDAVVVGGGIAGLSAAIYLGRRQARRFGAEFVKDTITELSREGDGTFHLRGRLESCASRHVLLATGLFHLPPDFPGVAECIGHSIFFCKDCDGLRCEGKRIGEHYRTEERSPG